MRATRHNGRSGKHGVYNPKHNDRKFDIANSEHIDAEREKQNIYWDCYRGYVQNPSDETLRNWGPVEPEASFHDIEKMYYEDHYSDFIKGQNARNEKNRHPERNRTTEDLLKNKMTCPEETIFQIGKEGEHISGEQLFHIADSFMKRFEGMFGDHVHIVDFLWILMMMATMRFMRTMITTGIATRAMMTMLPVWMMPWKMRIGKKEY